MTRRIERVIVLGNCQTVMLANLLQAMSGFLEAVGVVLSAEQVSLLATADLDLTALAGDFDLILINMPNLILPAIRRHSPHLLERVRIVPGIHHVGFHPDLVYVKDSAGRNVVGPLGEYQSSIAFFCWLNNLDTTQAKALFAGDVYEQLGFYGFAAQSERALIESERDSGMDLGSFVQKWSRAGCWMHSINHPKAFVMADIAGFVLETAGLPIIPNAAEYVHDYLADGPVFPVYPEVAERFGMTGHLMFKRDRGASGPQRPVFFLNLDEFLKHSFDAFAQYPKETLSCDRLLFERYLTLKEFMTERSTRRGALIAEPHATTPARVANGGNPYKNLPDFHFWRRSVENVPMQEVDPVVRTSFRLDRHTKVATAGSCFAQHIARVLKEQGFNYHVTEPGDAGSSGEELAKRNFGVFSARYGNVYSTRQLLQLFERAYGLFVPTEQTWEGSDGRYMDPFRPYIEPAGFASIEELAANQDRHFSAVRTMFETTEIFVFTLGLTEAWMNKVDGAVYPIAPGVAGPNFRPEIHQFVNFSVAEVVDDLQAFIDKLRGVNAAVKIILTVSPVPLVATYENCHVLAATTYSKSVLRVAAQEICRRNAAVDYFPSFEIVMGNYAKGRYFENDLRSITADGVHHVMSTFLKHYASERNETVLSRELLEEHHSLRRIVCDEEAVDSNRQ